MSSNTGSLKRKHSDCTDNNIGPGYGKQPEYIKPDLQPNPKKKCILVPINIWRTLTDLNTLTAGMF